MPKYRRIPGEPIEAGQWGRDIRIADRHPGIFFEEGPVGWHVVTIHGQKTKIIDGDWILPEPDGIHYYPCKPDVFAKTYELAEPPGLQKAIMDTCGLRDDDLIGTLAGDEQVRFVGVDHASGPDKCVRVKGERLPHGGLRIDSIEEVGRAVDTTDITETAIHIPGVVSNQEPGQDEDWVFKVWWPDDPDYEFKIWASGRVEGFTHAVIVNRMPMLIAQLEEENVSLRAQLQAEGEHTEAANANIDRLNTEIERITRRQQGPLMGKG